MNPSFTPSEQAWFLLHGNLSAAEQAETRAHLESTPEGRVALAEVGVTHRLLANVLPREQDDEALVTEILAELEADLPELGADSAVIPMPVPAVAARKPGFGGPRVWIPAAAAACVAAALLGARLLPGISWEDTRVVPAVYQGSETPAATAGFATFQSFGDEVREALKASFAQTGRPSGRWRLAVTVKELKAGAELVVQATSGGQARQWSLLIDSQAHFAENRDAFVTTVTRDLLAPAPR